VVFRLDSHQSATSVRTTRSFRPDAQLSKASAVRMTCLTVRTLIRLKHHPSGRRGFLSGPSFVSRSLELLQLASFRTFQQPVRTTLSVRPSFKFSFQNQIWEDCCNRPGALLLKASSQLKINRSDASLPWFGRAYDRYGNCVQQITSPDGHPPGLDARSLYKEITCSERATVRTTVPYSLDVALKQERSSVKLFEFRSHSCPSGRPMTTIRTAPSFIKANAHLSP
jgi:hypothetical protein